MLQGHQIQSSWEDIDDSLPSRGVLKDPQHSHTLFHPLVHLRIPDVELLLPFLDATEGEPLLLQRFSGRALLGGRLAEVGGRS